MWKVFNWIGCSFFFVYVCGRFKYQTMYFYSCLFTKYINFPKKLTKFISDRNSYDVYWKLVDKNCRAVSMTDSVHFHCTSICDDWISEIIILQARKSWNTLSRWTLSYQFGGENSYSLSLFPYIHMYSCIQFSWHWFQSKNVTEMDMRSCHLYACSCVVLLTFGIVFIFRLDFNVNVFPFMLHLLHSSMYANHRFDKHMLLSLSVRRIHPFKVSWKQHVTSFYVKKLAYF